MGIMSQKIWCLILRLVLILQPGIEILHQVTHFAQTQIILRLLCTQIWYISDVLQKKKIYVIIIIAIHFCLYHPPLGRSEVADNHAKALFLHSSSFHRASLFGGTFTSL